MRQDSIVYHILHMHRLSLMVVSCHRIRTEGILHINHLIHRTRLTYNISANARKINM